MVQKVKLSYPAAMKATAVPSPKRTLALENKNTPECWCLLTLDGRANVIVFFSPLFLSLGHCME